MSGLVDQLQKEAMDQGIPITSLLRRVKVAAVKLNLSDALDWVDSELNGYQNDVPEYRNVVGVLKWLNPYRGWLPVGFGDNETANQFQAWPIPESVASLEATLASQSDTYVLQMPAAVTNALSQGIGVRVSSAVCEVGRGTLVGIIEHVRGLVLDWALELERAGITGEGMSFSNQEKEMAKDAHISIGSFHGTFNTGDLTGPNARITQGSTDNSTNIASDGSVFGEIQAAIKSGVDDEVLSARLLGELERIRTASSPETKLAAYTQFVGDAANHMTLLAPFLPALTALLN